MTNKPINSRLVAAKIIADWIATGNFPDRAVTKITADRAFVTEVVYGAIRRKANLEWIINQFVSREQDWFVEACMMVGIYQLLFMDNVEEYAAVSETVNAVKSENAHVGGFVNGVLRNCQRQAEDLKKRLQEEPLETRESHPRALTRRWTRTFGEEKCAELCVYNNTRPQTVISPNILQTTTPDYQARLSKEGIETTPHPMFPELCLVLPRNINPASLPGFKEGIFSVQDPSTWNAVLMIDPQPGDNILDACAAPGGKTVLLAQRVQKDGSVTAMDIYDDRLDVLLDNVERMQLDNVKIFKGDASLETELRRISDGKKFDKILLDVPCTNTGVLRRRPDARWRFSRHRMKELAILQDSMLTAASQLLVPGGKLVYSTCSLEPEEGERIISAWLQSNEDFELIEQKTVWPPEACTDGSFTALLVKQQ
jgi:16S rRNA (cytosine967-C5)-methyltransferase